MLISLAVPSLDLFSGPTHGETGRSASLLFCRRTSLLLDLDISTFIYLPFNQTPLKSLSPDPVTVKVFLAPTQEFMEDRVQAMTFSFQINLHFYKMGLLYVDSEIMCPFMKEFPGSQLKV